MRWGLVTRQLSGEDGAGKDKKKNGEKLGTRYSIKRDGDSSQACCLPRRSCPSSKTLIAGNCLKQVRNACYQPIVTRSSDFDWLFCVKVGLDPVSEPMISAAPS